MAEVQRRIFRGPIDMELYERYWQDPNRSRPIPIPIKKKKEEKYEDNICLTPVTWRCKSGYYKN